MKICKNCHSENAAGAIRCAHCNMEGNFIPLNGNQTEPLFVEKSVQQCKNCGTEVHASAVKCSECNFPVPKVEVPKAQLPQAQVQKPVKSYTPFQPWEISKHKTG